MKYKYSVVNNRLIPSDTTELVLAQELGRRFIYTEIICRACEDVDSRIQTLLNNAEKKEIICSFNKTEIMEMYKKFLDVNNTRQDDVYIIMAAGRKDILFIGNKACFFKNDS